jgi:hypothetical protein
LEQEAARLNQYPERSHRLGANTLWYQDFVPSSGRNRLIDHLIDAEEHFFDFSFSWMPLQERVLVGPDAGEGLCI